MSTGASSGIWLIHDVCRPDHSLSDQYTFQHLLCIRVRIVQHWQKLKAVLKQARTSKTRSPEEIAAREQRLSNYIRTVQAENTCLAKLLRKFYPPCPDHQVNTILALALVKTIDRYLSKLLSFDVRSCQLTYSRYTLSRGQRRLLETRTLFRSKS